MEDFSIKPIPTTIKNSQANSILKKVHQAFITMLRTKNLQKYDFDDIDPWDELLISVAWSICRTHHTTLQATPDQLVFGRDMLLHLKLIVDWEATRLRIQKDVNRNKIA